MKYVYGLLILNYEVRNINRRLLTPCHVIIPEKERELGAAQAEIKALRATEALKDKAIEEVVNFGTHKALQFCVYNKKCFSFQYYRTG